MPTIEKAVWFHNWNGRYTHKVILEGVGLADIHRKAQEYIVDYLSEGSGYEVRD